MKEAIRKREEQTEHNMSYKNAVREFVRETISNPNFFDLPPMEQKQAAMNTIQKHKNVSR
ncbi:hypothetical protein SMD22_01095 (plasmid) [Brevibacillus halotolerans]|nr:hypothetical protein SMD22_01095 [Brevibacillus halotolerans]